jgi:hypothetical protein
MVFSRNLTKLHLEIGGGVVLHDRPHASSERRNGSVPPLWESDLLTAAECSHCGSREPGGPDIFSRKEIRQRVIEAP